ARFSRRAPRSLAPTGRLQGHPAEYPVLAYLAPAIPNSRIATQWQSDPDLAHRAGAHYSTNPANASGRYKVGPPILRCPEHPPRGNWRPDSCVLRDDSLPQEPFECIANGTHGVLRRSNA